MARRQRGFSLIELAVVLVIIGLLVGGGIAAISATTEQTRRSDQKRIFGDVREALYGFAMAKGRFPCPDTDGDGAENTSLDPDAPDPGDVFQCGGRFNPPPSSPVQGRVAEGELPWQDLGIGRRDAWGHPIRYAVDTDFAENSTGTTGAVFGINTDAHLHVMDSTGGNAIVQNAPAILVSYGPQGQQVWTGSGFVCPDGSAGFSTDEINNCDRADGDDDGVFVDAGYRTADGTGGRFDDMLLWIPESVLKSRMVQAGKLP